MYVVNVMDCMKTRQIRCALAKHMVSARHVKILLNKIGGIGDNVPSYLSADILCMGEA